MGNNIIGWDEDEVGGEELYAGNLPQSFAASPKATLAVGTDTLEITPLRDIRPDRFLISRDKTQDVTVSDIKIGTVSLNASTGDMPADAFAPDAVGTSMRATKTATPSLHIFVSVSNNSANPITNFSVGVIGPSSAG